MHKHTLSQRIRPSTSIRKWSLPIACALAFSSTASGQAPIGPEIAVNSFITGNQSDPSVVLTADDEYALVWFSHALTTDSGPPFSIRGRRLAADGSALSGDFQISTTTVGIPFLNSAAALPDGGFVAIWESDHQDGSDYGVFGRAFDGNGSPLTDPFQVNTYTTGRQRSPDVAVTSTGELVVVWQGQGPSTDYGIHGRRLQPDGTAIGEELSISDGDSQGRSPEVAVDHDGGFLVVYSRFNGSTRGDIQGRRFTSTGAPIGEELTINSTTVGSQLRPDVATDSNGDFVVVWNSTDDQDGSGYGIFGRRISSAPRLPTGGAPFLGQEFQVNTVTPGHQTYPKVAAGPHGAFVVSWSDHGTSGPGYSSRIAARWFGADGVPRGDDFTVNQIAEGDHFKPAPAIARDDDFLIAWTTAEFEVEGNTSEVRAQRFVAPCVESDTTLCLGEGRFRARVMWRDFADAEGHGHALPRTDDSGAFWFFDPQNLELIVKVLDGREINDHFWVFFGSLSNVEFTLTVTDTVTGASKTYLNPLGSFGSNGDTTALPDVP